MRIIAQMRSIGFELKRGVGSFGGHSHDIMYSIASDVALVFRHKVYTALYILS